MEGPLIATELRVITREWLEEHEACDDHVEKFAATFGDEAELTRANAIKAARAGLDIDWLAGKLLDATALRAYEEAKVPAWRAYQEAKAPAWRAYQEARAPAWRAYQEATAPALRAYEEARAPAWRAYQEAETTALRAYEEAKATALCDALHLP
jgi:hypothetical protein